VQNPALAYATTFAIEFLQKNFRERRGWVIANLSFDGAAIRKCDVYNASGNSVAPTNDVAIFGGTADFKFSGFRHFYVPMTSQTFM
jgi:hypothetical protein